MSDPTHDWGLMIVAADLIGVAIYLAFWRL